MNSNSNSSSGLLGYAMAPFAYTFRLLIDVPMRYFYIHGHWRGIGESDVCASLSHYDADFWRTQPTACGQIIDRQVGS